MAVVAISGLFKGYDFQLVQSGLDASLIEMYALSLNYCLSKFFARGSEPPSLLRTLSSKMVYGIIAGIRRFIAEKNSGLSSVKRGIKYEKISEAKSAEVSEVLAPKCSTNNKEMKDTEVTVGIGNSNTPCDQFMASAYFENCKINIYVNK